MQSRCSILVGVLITLLATVAFGRTQQEIGVWVEQIRPTAIHKLLQNISPTGTVPGTVVASPSREHPDYFYHWIRDAGLVMDVVVGLYEKERDPHQRQRLEQIIFDFLDLTKRQQQMPNLSGGVGEPKFLVDGTPFMGPWGRPQDDGPAIRAFVYTRLANIWIREGKEWLVREKLYDGTWYSVAKVDLEYVSHHWKNTCVDLWEEVNGHHFFTRMVQRRALLEGSELARHMGDNHAAAWYESQGHAMTPEIERHWDANHQLVRITLNWQDGINYKHSGLDAGVALGVIHGQTDVPLFTEQDGRILSTVHKLRETFKNIYKINNEGHRGVAIGRYPEDRYTGHGDGEGNPWFLTGHAIAELLYRSARGFEKSGKIKITPQNLAFFQSIQLKGAWPGKVYTASKDTYEYGMAVARIHEMADDYLAVTQFHMDDAGSMAEQMNRYTGFMQGAHDLTWSYASLITAIDHR